jgi:hypothetical protein
MAPAQAAVAPHCTVQLEVALHSMGPEHELGPVQSTVQSWPPHAIVPQELPYPHTMLQLLASTQLMPPPQAPPVQVTEHARPGGHCGELHGFVVLQEIVQTSPPSLSGMHVPPAVLQAAWHLSSASCPASAASIDASGGTTRSGPESPSGMVSPPGASLLVASTGPSP